MTKAIEDYTTNDFALTDQDKKWLAEAFLKGEIFNTGYA